MVLAGVSLAWADTGRHHNTFAGKTQSRRLHQIMSSKQLRFHSKSRAPLEGEAHPMCHRPYPVPSALPPTPCLSFRPDMQPHPAGGSPCLSTAPISCPWWLLWSPLFPWSLGQRKLGPHPWGPAYPQLSEGTGPHHREAGPILRPFQGPVLQIGGHGTYLRDWSSSGNVPKDPVASSWRLQDHITQEVTRISLISKWKNQKQGKNCHFRRVQEKLQSWRPHCPVTKPCPHLHLGH